MAICTIALLCANIYIIGSYLFIGSYGGNPANVAAVEYILWGPYWYGFWIFQIGLGVLVPLGILITILTKHDLKRKWMWAARAGALVIIGTAVARLNFIIPSQVTSRSDFDLTPYTNIRLEGNYVPTLPEWAFSAGIIAVFVILFYVTAKKMKLLPIVFTNGETN